MFQFADPPPGPAYVPTMGEQLFHFVMVYLLLLGLIALCLPRPWFVALFKIAFPFMPDSLPRGKS
jgi:hypothetical protein